MLNDFSSYLTNDGKNEKTVQAYIPIIKSLSRWYANTTGEQFTPEAITVLDLKDWVSFLKINKKFSQATINKYINAARAYFNFLSEEHNLQTNPAGYLSSTYDPHGRPTVMDLLKGIQGRLYPVGRLDLDTRGLLLLSNDGEFTNKIIHPRYHVDKKYQVLVKGQLSEKALRQLRKGVQLEDGLTSPAEVKVLQTNTNSTLIEMSIHEGRKRQVKRMLAQVGFPVISLKRTAIAFLDLGNLEEGQYRHLDPHEVKGLLDLAQSGVPEK